MGEAFPPLQNDPLQFFGETPGRLSEISLEKADDGFGKVEALSPFIEP
ncbi:Uncharacterised protein [Mycobacterium tuberculosis]|nr:Uncharacterised protein [Mycobacterium tuberculosis]